MTLGRIDKQLIAGDIYPRWKREVQTAKQNILIFSPYLGKPILRLIDHKTAELPHDKITVVTTLDERAVAYQPSHLLTIKSLQKKNVVVKRLEGLHAKVLLVDHKKVTLGSQNFTVRGRESKEVSIRFAQPITDTAFLTKLKRWRREAKEIDPLLVEKMLAIIAPHAKQYARLVRKIKGALQEQQEEIAIEKKKQQKEQEATRVKRLLRRIQQAEKRSKIQLAEGPVYAFIQQIDTNPYSPYATLRPWGGRHFTDWIISRGETKEPYQLNRVHMYPILNADNGRLAFGRICKTRITYIRYVVKWSEKSLPIGDYKISADVTFPQKVTIGRANIRLALSAEGDDKVAADVWFSGTDYQILRWRSDRGCSEGFKQTLSTELFARRQQFRKVFETCLSGSSGFKYKTLNRPDKKIHSFFDKEYKGYYRLSLVTFAENPVMVVKRYMRPSEHQAIYRVAESTALGPLFSMI